MDPDTRWLLHSLELAADNVAAVGEASIVVLVDRATQRRYRVWRGDVIGGAELVAVRPDEAVFVVTVFGVSRQETLRLKKQKERDG